MSKRKTKSSSTSTGTQTTTPQLPAWLQAPVQGLFGEVGGMIGRSPATYGPTANQTAAFQAASGLGANGAINSGIDATRGLLDFTPQNVSTRWNANTINGPNANDYQASLMDSAPSVSAGLLRETDLSPYLNPYTKNVVDTSLAALDRSREMAISQGQAMATRAGAFGGSRHGVADAETNRGFMDSAGQLAAGLYNEGFNTARQSALADIANRFTADQFNAANAMTVAGRNQDAQNLFMRALADDRMRTQLANQGAYESAAGRSLQGQLANQQAGLAGAGFRLGAANQLYNQGVGQDANTRSNIGLQAGMGEIERQLQQDNDPVLARLRYLAQLSQVLGINAGDLVGQTTTGNQTSSGTTSQSGMSFGFNWGPFSIGG